MGSIAYEIEHISDHAERVWLRKAIESGRFRAAARPGAARRPAPAPDAGRGLRAVPPPLVPRAEAVLARGPRRARADARRDDRARRRGRRARGRDRHGAPRTAERARPHGRTLVRVDPARVRGRALATTRSSSTPRAAAATSSTTCRRRARGVTAGRRDRRHDRAEPEPSRGGRSRRRGLDAGRADRPLERRGAARPDGRARRPHPRRRGVPGPGRRRRDAQPAEPRGLLDRRDAAPDHEQPGRLHDRPGGGRSTRYSSDLAKGFDVPIVHVNADDPEAALSAVRLALAYRAEFGHDFVIDLVGYRRFGHNEQDEAAYTQPLMVERIESAADGARAVRRTARRGGRRHAGGGRRDPRRGGRSRCARRTTGCARRSPSRRRRPRSRRSRRTGTGEAVETAVEEDRLRAAERAAARRAGGLHRAPEARAAARAPARDDRARAGSTGARPRRSRSPRSSRTASRSASRVRTPSAAPSRTGISCSTTPDTGETVRADPASRRARTRRSRSTTRRSRSTRRSGSSTATRSPRRTRSSSGRRSSATSSTARRS